MSDWPGGWPDTNPRYDSEVQTPRIIPGEVWHSATYPLQESPVPPASPPCTTASSAAPSYVALPHQRDNRSAYGGGGGPTPSPGPSPKGGPTRPTRPTRVPRSRPSRRRRIARMVFLLVFVLLVASTGTYVWAETRLTRSVDLDKANDRPPHGKGTNYLIVGSDSREGLSDQAKDDLHTGSAEGSRTDSMILLHTGANGTTMTSLPRDSWVTIPSFTRPQTGKHYRAAKNKLNAAYSLGGADLLVRTVEHNTGLRIDHYAEIGFAGLVGVVNAVGGVEMCLERDIKDEKSNLDLKKGCHTLDGSKALAFVRQRHQEAEGDLGRTKNQQKFLAALAGKAATPGVALDPSKLYPTMSAGLSTLIVDKDMDLRKLTSLFQAMKSVATGGGKRINVPVSSIGFQTSKGSAVKWDTKQSKKLFAELRNDQPVSFEEKEKNKN